MKYDAELLIDVLRGYWLKQCKGSVSTYEKFLSKYVSPSEISFSIDAQNLLKYMQINGVPPDIEAIINEYILTYKI